MEIITFFSFKGGVGRTQALLNTACEFAQRGKNVLLLDFDLHAPGLSLMECMAPRRNEAKDKARPGVLDFFEWLVLLDEAVRRGEPPPEPVDLAACAYEPPFIKKHLGFGAGYLKLVPASRLSKECDDATSYSDRVHTIDSPLTEVIRRTHRNRERNPVIEQIRAQFTALEENKRPDAIFIDARTGITGIADLLLTRSSDRIVLVTGLNDQNLWGLESTLQDIERAVKTADWLHRITIVISPVPEGELQLTDERIQAIAKTLERHVDKEEQKLFGSIGLIPDPIQIPYNAQLALREDPILFRHPDSLPAKRYEVLADRLGGKMEPLRYKEEESTAKLEKPPSEATVSLPEHPLARVLPWNAGLGHVEAASILHSLKPRTQPGKPDPDWQRHTLNYMAQTLNYFDSDAEVLYGMVTSLKGLSVAQRTAQLKTLREQRLRLFATPQKSWHFHAERLGRLRGNWLKVIRQEETLDGVDLSALVSEKASASAWGPYWTGLAEALRLQGFREQAIALLKEGAERLGGETDFEDAAIQCLSMANAYPEALAIADRWITRLKSKTSSQLAYALTRKADVLRLTGQLDEALELLRQAEVLAEQDSNNPYLAFVAKQLGELLFRRGELELARAHYSKALPLFRKLQNRHGEANTLDSLADLLLRLDQPQKAREHGTKALQLYREVQYRLGEANALRTLGDIGLHNDELEIAREHYKKALPLYRAVQSRLGEANTLLALGDLLVRTDKLENARANLDQALGLYLEIKDDLGETNALQSLAKWHLARREYDACGKLVSECLTRYQNLSDPEGLWETQLLLARLRAKLGFTEEAATIAVAVEEEARAKGHLLLVREAREMRELAEGRQPKVVEPSQ